VVIAMTFAAPEAHAAAPSPTDVESARAHYKRGVQLYEAGSYEAALVELERADQLAPTYKLLYNLALVQMRLGDFAGAHRSFSSYLEAGGAEIPPARRAEVDRSLTLLGAHVASVEITTDMSGAEVSIDDRTVGTTPLRGPIQLNPGPHRISAVKEGFTTAIAQVDVGGGEREVVSLALRESVPEPPLTPGPPPAPQPEEPPAPEPPLAQPPGAARPPTPAPEAHETPTWIGWSAAGLFAVGAVVTGVAALGESRKLTNEIDGAPTAGATIHSTHQTTVTLALVSDILTGAAVATGGVTLYLTLARTRPAAPSASHAELRVGPGSIALSGAF
jgi:hypothetical protein